MLLWFALWFFWFFIWFIWFHCHGDCCELGVFYFERFTSNVLFRTFYFKQIYVYLHASFGTLHFEGFTGIFTECFIRNASFRRFYRYFDTHPQLFHEIREMMISWSYTCRKWKYDENSEKCERGCQNTCKIRSLCFRLLFLRDFWFRNFIFRWYKIFFTIILVFGSLLPVFSPFFWCLFFFTSILDNFCFDLSTYEDRLILCVVFRLIISYRIFYSILVDCIFLCLDYFFRTRYSVLLYQKDYS